MNLLLMVLLTVMNPRTVLAALCAIFVMLSRAEAAALPLSLPANVAANAAGGYVTTGATAFSGAAFNSGFTTQVAGKAVTVPASWRFAANAASVASAAARTNPYVFVGVAVASWLLPHGIEWVNNQWQKKIAPQPGDAVGTGYYYIVFSLMAPSPTDACNRLGQDVLNSGADGPGARYIATLDGSLRCSITIVRANGSTRQSHQNAVLQKSNNYYPGGATAPAGDSDWATVANSPLPDAAANEMSQKGLGIPVVPEVAPSVQTIPLSDPYTDPVTGKRYRDVAYITPNPANPRTADLQVVKQEVNEDGSPVEDPNTGQPKPPEETDDECLKHPDRVACKDWGETPNVPDLQKSEKTITIVPQGGWGADTAACPADLTYTTRTGSKAVAFSFKPACDGADTFRPVILAMAWILAAFIALGINIKGGD